MTVLGLFAEQARRTPARAADRTPLVQALVVIRNAPAREPRFSGLSVTEVPTPVVSAVFDLTVEFRETGDGLHADFVYDSALFDGATVERMAGRLRTLLTRIAQDPGHDPARLSLLPDAEEHRVLTEWNASGEPADGHRVHEVFADQVRRGPDRPAVISGADRISYGELDARANRLAHHLAARGVGPETLRAGSASTRCCGPRPPTNRCPASSPPTRCAVRSTRPPMARSAARAVASSSSSGWPTPSPTTTTSTPYCAASR